MDIMDGRGRALDNIFVERLWRSLKYELVYRHDFVNVPELLAALNSTLSISSGIAHRIH